jgi:DNA-binding transcriptional regulator YiaG
MQKTKSIPKAGVTKTRQRVFQRRDPSFGLKLRALRERHGASQQELANRLYTTWVTVSRWKRGKAEPPPDARARALRLLELEEEQVQP